MVDSQERLATSGMAEWIEVTRSLVDAHIHTGMRSTVLLCLTGSSPVATTTNNKVTKLVLTLY